MATINGVEVIGDKSAHDFDLLDKDDGINLANGVERNREAAEDNHKDIVRHRTDTDVHVTPAWKNSLVTKAILGLYWTAAQTADIINSISIASGAKLQPVEALPDVGVEQIIYMVPKKDPQQGDIFDEYVWINGKYEFIGTSKVNLSNYYNKTEIDYFFALLETQYVKVDDTTLVRLVNENEINLQEDHYNAWFGYRNGKVTNWKFGDGTEGGLADVYVKDLYLGDKKLSDLLGDKAKDADVVHLTGNETINGVKTFASNITIQGGKKVVCNVDNSFLELNGGTTWGKGGSIVLSGQDRVSYTNSVLIVSKNDTDTFIIEYQNGILKPRQGDNYLGTSANKWKDVNTELINGEPVVTPTYLVNKSEEWEFTLSDGSTVTKKIVMA